MSIVAIERCQDYNLENVRRAVRRSVEALGGMSAFINPGERVLLKPNLLMRRKPEKATTTHPAVVRAVAELVLEAGGKPVIFDSPGGYLSHTKGMLEALYETCGMREAAELCDAELCFDEETVDAAIPDGRVIKSVKMVRSVRDADKIISIPKLKTHMMMTYSGAVKNLFGIVPGSAKTEFHFRFEDEDDFAGVLVDICGFAKPVLTVMDAVVGMEGDGPSNGKPRKLGFVLTSGNPYELDIAACAAIGLDPRKTPIARACAARSLCSCRAEDLEIAGESLESIAVRDFEKPASKIAFNIWDWFLPKSLALRANRAMKFKPAFEYGKCLGCGVCERSCPARAIDMSSGKPRVDLTRCISCFCCHELCNYDAVKITKPLLMRALFR